MPLRLTALLATGALLGLAQPLLLVAAEPAAAADQSGELTAATLQQALTGAQTPSCELATLRTQDSTTALRELYAGAAFAPLWQDATRLQALQHELQQLQDDGLNTADYPQALQAAAVQDLCTELQISSEYLLALEHLSHGRFSQMELEPPWLAPGTEQLSLPALVATASLGLEQPQLAFERVRPALDLYRNLRRAYAALDQQGAERPPFPAGPSLRPGMQDARLPQLAERLRSDGYLPSAYTLPASRPYDDPTLHEAVRRFQADHGLETDGIVGRRTVAALNLDPGQRLQQVRINLERLRWLNARRADYSVLVNSAGGSIRLYRGQQQLWQSRVMTGRPERPTPLLVSRIDRITLNPSWTLPPTIMKEDALPQIRADLGYLATNQLQVLDLAGNPLDPQQVDWSQPERILLRQPPGPANPLGRMVFRFANPLAVFLHDTPAQQLFAKAGRNVSSGCVRVEGAELLADQLWSSLTAGQRAAIDAQLASGETSEVPLSGGPQLILAYWTAEARDDGSLLLLPDPYQRDPALLAAFAQLDGRQERSSASHVGAVEIALPCSTSG